MRRPKHTPKRGIVSVPRPVTKGFQNEWLNEPPVSLEAVGFLDPRRHDWDYWQGPEARK